MALLFSSCRDDIIEIITIDDADLATILSNYHPEVRMVDASVVIFVTDENGSPIDDAILSIGTNTGQSDEYGHFTINDISLNALGAVIHIEKAGYHNSSRRFRIEAGETSIVRVQLIEKEFLYSFDAAAGGIVDLPSGTFLLFEGLSIVDAMDNQYLGEVKVAFEWLDPDRSETALLRPGSMDGVNSSSQEVALFDHGTIAVSLEGTSGQPLNLKDGKVAEVRMPVPTSLRANAPGIIPLWFYYDVLGIWIMQGKAEKQGDFYVGEVAHFSFWNCALGNNGIHLDARILKNSGDPALHQYVTIWSPLYGTTGAYTIWNGVVNGNVPANSDLILHAFNNCDEVIHSYSFTTTNSNIDLGDITLPQFDNINSTIVQGQLIDCSGEAIENGLLIVELDGETDYLYIDGSPFEFAFSMCDGNEEISFIGVDRSNYHQSEQLTLPAYSSTNLEEILVCDLELEYYIEITISGHNYIWPWPWLHVEQEVDTWINGSVGSGAMILDFEGLQAGDYSNANTLFFLSTAEYPINEIEVIGGTFSNFIVTSYGSSGQSCSGTFSGMLTDLNNGQVYEAFGSFNVLIP